jgi:hypothetical protein
VIVIQALLITARFDLLVIVKARMWVWPTLKVRPLFIAAPIGILSTMPTYTPGMEIVKPPPGSEKK